MIASHLRESVNKVARPLGRAVGRTGVSANTLTWAGLIILTAGTIIAARGHIVSGATVIGVGGVLDLIDGAVAKATGTATKYGAFLDSTTDRLSDGVLFSGIIWYIVHHPPTGATLGISASVALVLAMVVMVLGFTTSYAKARAEAMGFTCNVGIAERSERVLIAAFGWGLHLLYPALAILTVLTTVTVIQRFVVVAQQAKSAS